MNYAELIKLGFERIESEDNEWLNEYGYGYFFLVFKLKDGYGLDWHPIEPKKVNIYENGIRVGTLSNIDNVKKYIGK